MKLTPVRTTYDRSLQRRFLLSGAEPVRSYLPPNTEFIPADLRIWWSAKDDQPEAEHTLSIYAWPAEHEGQVSAHWTGGYSSSPLPAWIRDLSEAVHRDLIANTTSSKTRSDDSWAYCAENRWTLDGAEIIPSLRYPHHAFAPADLSIWHSYHPAEAGRNRHTIRAFPADRGHNLSAHWDGGTNWDGSTRYSDGLPKWIRDLAEAQYERLACYARQHENHRGTR